ncbi:MAG: hypothetical protein J6S26_04010, partial [Solobacterium sp.]|nr:hypothetical protein [Solobacterium sp.]
MSRVLFRTTCYGIIFQLVLDILWVLIEGRIFPGAIFANRVINALYLGVGVVLACIWYLYVLETLGYRITKNLQIAVMTPGIIFMILNIISIRTGWIFTVSPENIYSHGPLFWLQTIGAYGMILVSFAHITIELFRRRNNRAALHDIKKLYLFYVITIFGAIISLFETGMPGTWTCASISIVLIYLDDQNREILSGMITAMSADYRSIYYADLDRDECVCVRASAESLEQMWEGKTFSFREGFRDYADHCVSKADREAFLQFVEPENIRKGLANEAMISFRYLADVEGLEQFEVLRIAGVRTIEDRQDHIVHA